MDDYSTLPLFALQPQYITLHPNAKDVTGQRFNRLVALGPIERASDRRIVWLCRCDCGKTTKASSNSLRSGNTKSCGCFRKENSSRMNFKHGLGNESVCQAWRDITKRCNNPNSKSYKNYGGRGITICGAWSTDFMAFYDYVIQLPDCGTKGYSLDRIDNDGNYEPGNVRWVTQKQQTRNKRTNHLLTHKGKTQCIVAWAEELNLRPITIHSRLRYGWTVEKTLSTPVGG